MSGGRPSRSSSIPIPPRNTGPSSSPSRNIETLISIPITRPSRPHPSNTSPASASSLIGYSPRRPNDDYHNAGTSASVRGHPGISISPSVSSFPTRSVSVSYGARPGPARAVEPRIVGPSSARPTEPPCIPSSSPINVVSTSPSRTRRPSGAGIPGFRSPSIQRRASTSGSIGSYSSTGNNIFHPAAPPPPSSVPLTQKPAYLEHSALRHLLQIETVPTLLPSRKTVDNATTGNGYSNQTNARNSRFPYYTGRGSPSDSDDDSAVNSPPRDKDTSRRQRLSLSPQRSLYNLPTRWSEQTKLAALSVSPDGREVAFSGILPCF